MLTFLVSSRSSRWKERRQCRKCELWLDESKFTEREWLSAVHGPVLARKSITNGKCRNCKNTGFFLCKGPCGKKLDKAYFTSFLQTAYAKSNLGYARCDECWSSTRGFHRCKKCGEKRDEASFTNFLETSSAKTNLGDACCNTCWDSVSGFLTCKGCDTKRDRTHFTQFLKTTSGESHLGRARCNDCFGKQKWTCKKM